MNKQLLQQALDALVAMRAYAWQVNSGLRICDETIADLRAAIAAPEVEPVGYAYAPDGDFDGCVIKTSSFKAETALYTAPPDIEALRKELDEVKTSLRLCVNRLRPAAYRRAAAFVAGEMTCQHCKHWAMSADGKENCRNNKVLDMLESYEGAWFLPPADFGCNKWEAKV